MFFQKFTVFLVFMMSTPLAYGRFEPGDRVSQRKKWERSRPRVTQRGKPQIKTRVERSRPRLRASDAERRGFAVCMRVAVQRRERVWASATVGNQGPTQPWTLVQGERSEKGPNRQQK